MHRCLRWIRCADWLLNADAFWFDVVIGRRELCKSFALCYGRRLTMFRKGGYEYHGWMGVKVEVEVENLH